MAGRGGKSQGWPTTAQSYILPQHVLAARKGTLGWGEKIITQILGMGDGLVWTIGRC